jgi:hypothetical protein
MSTSSGVPSKLGTWPEQMCTPPKVPQLGIGKLGGWGAAEPGSGPSSSPSATAAEGISRLIHPSMAADCRSQAMCQGRD